MNDRRSLRHLSLNTPHAPSWKDRRWTSRVLHRLDEAGSHPTSGLVATQLKLDELIRVTTRADDGLIAVQEAPDGLLDRLTESTVAGREWD